MGGAHAETLRDPGGLPLSPLLEGAQTAIRETDRRSVQRQAGERIQQVPNPLGSSTMIVIMS